MTNNSSIVKRSIYSIFLVCSSFHLMKCEVLVTARCGRPGLPPGAKFYRKPLEKFRFDNNEEVIVICKENDFPHHKQTRICKNGHWIGKKARCGKTLDAQVIQFQIENCESPNNDLLLSQAINQTIVPDRILPRNSFHYLRVHDETILSANDSTCYLWKIKFDRTVQITFLIVDIFMPITNLTKDVPNLVPTVSKYRNCELQHRKPELLGVHNVVGYYYFCDLKSDEDQKKELNELSDTILIRINTSIPREIGLEALIIGDIYTEDTVGPDCGDLEIENTGADIRKESGYFKVSCNNSFMAHQQNPEESKEFTCNSNGEWVGKWPVCVPIVSCSQDEIIRYKDPTIVIEEIGNVYYLNSSQWFAINGSWVQYACRKDNGIMVGKHFRTCMENGKWSDKRPYCTVTSLSGFTIAGILFVVLVIIVLVVFLVFHSKRVKRELAQALNKIGDTAIKRFSGDYIDVDQRNFYESDSNFLSKSIMHERVIYDDIGSDRTPSTAHEYLDIIAISEEKKP